MYFLPDMTWQEIREYLKETQTVLLPVGSIEQHGPHLPINQDRFQAVGMCRMIAEEAIKQGLPVAMAEPISFGVTPHHEGFHGTIHLRRSTFEDLVYDVVNSLYLSGFKNIIMVNGHGGNSSSLSSIITDCIHTIPDANIILYQYWIAAADVVRSVMDSQLWHACEGETSIGMYLGQNVRVDKIADHTYIANSQYKSYDFNNTKNYKIGHNFAKFKTKEVWHSGSIGNPTLATAEKGEKILKATVERAIPLIKELNEGTF